MSLPNNTPSDGNESGDWRESDWFAIWLHLARLPAAWSILCICTVCAIGVISAGCTTVHPVHTEAAQASYDGGIENSGFDGWSTNAGTGEISGILTSHARDRYNALCATYGKHFAPPLGQDSGLLPDPAADTSEAPPTWLIDREHLIYFATMNRWKKEGLKP
jgi:hypothetical protein